MKLTKKLGIVFTSAALVAACGTSDGELIGGEGAEPGQLVESSTLAPGDGCEAGGTSVQSGIDANQDGALGADEVTSSYNICSGTSTAGMPGADGEAGIKGPTGPDGRDVRSSAAPAGASCPVGGVAVSFGLDVDADGVLGAEEVTSISNVCAGASGADACAPVLRVTPQGPSASCPEGGVLVVHGDDSGELGAGGVGGSGPAMQCDGVLSASEEMGSQLICAGTTGAPGADGDPGPQGNPGLAGLNFVQVINAVGNSAQCIGGGFRVDSGYDADRSGSLVGAEITHVYYMCENDLDGDGVVNGTDNCPTGANPGQGDQDKDGVGDVCDASPCPGGVCLKSCAEVFAAGGNTTSGAYAINPTGGTPFLAQCDMTTDGGGWTLVLNYVHLRNTNPTTNARTGDLPRLQAGSALGQNQGGTAYWGHASPALFTAIGADETRFVASTSAHGRVMHFKTNACNSYFSTGSGQCSSMPGNFTALAGHTALLPTQIDSYWTNQGAAAMTNFPFYRGSNYHWGMHNGSARWEVDDFVINAADTWHQIWSRKKVPVSICASNPEGSTVTVTCPVGTVMTSIDYASYGTYNGTCGGNNLSNGTCHAASSQSVVQASCVGNNSCAVPATNGVFGDPCGGTYKRLAIRATCF